MLLELNTFKVTTTGDPGRKSILTIEDPDGTLIVYKAVYDSSNFTRTFTKLEHITLQ